MRQTRITLSAALVALAALQLAACAAPKPRKDVVWPDPPDKPRIKFVMSFQSDLDLERGNWAAFSRGLFGSTPKVKLSQPMGLALSRDGQKLYVADLKGSQVLVADFAARTLKPFAEDQSWSRPTGIALDARGNLYVSDSQARRVMVLSPRGDVLRAFGQELERPTGIAIDDERQIVYVTDTGRQDSQNHRVFAFTFEGKILREVGGGRGDGDGQFNFPAYLALDARGNLYVSDALNFRIQVFDPDGAFVRAFGEHGNSPGSFGRLKGLAFDSFGDLYVADGEHGVVQIFNPRLEPLMFFGGPAPRLEFMDIPSAVAVDPRTNRIYVANELTPRVNVYDLINTTAEEVLGEGAPEARPAEGQAPRPAQ